LKKVLFLCLFFAIYKNWTTLTGGYSDTNEVVLYSTDWCGYCKKARKFFNANNIKFQEYDIEKSDEGRRRYEELDGSSIPLILINGKRVNGYNKSKILKLLN
jgi:glutaredoxin